MFLNEWLIHEYTPWIHGMIHMMNTVVKTWPLLFSGGLVFSLMFSSCRHFGSLRKTVTVNVSEWMIDPWIHPLNTWHDTHDEYSSKNTPWIHDMTHKHGHCHACSSRQIHSNSPQTYTESGRDGGKKIPLYVFCLLQIFRQCLDGGGG